MKITNFRTAYAERAADLMDTVDAGDEPFLSLLKSTADELVKKQTRLNAMFRLHDEQGMGQIFANKLNQFGFVLPDASVQGAFRYQLFDPKGFFTHSTYKTLDEAVYELCDAGFHALADQHTLMELSSTTLWKFSTQALALRTAVEDGLYSWDEANVLYNELRLKHYPEAAAA